jgi:hypothetical protein
MAFKIQFFCKLFVVLFLFIGILIVLRAATNWNFSTSSQSTPGKKISMNKILFWIEMSKNNNIDFSMIRYFQLILKVERGTIHEVDSGFF